MGKIIMINNARCSYPQLWHEEEKEGGKKFGRGVTILLDQEKHAKVIREIKDGIKAVAAAEPKFKNKVPAAHLLCLRENDEEQYGDNVLLLKANTPKTPFVLNKDLTRATEEADPIYSGCRVNIKIDIWAQANQYGKRVNAKLIAIQFNADDASFDGSYIPEEEAVDGFQSDGNEDAGGMSAEDTEDKSFLD